MYAAGSDENWLTENVTTYGASASVISNPYLFTGRRWDSTTGLYYYRFRDYCPNLGRFLQPDPAGYIDGMNLYAYCGNNPINWIDPWGLDKKAMKQEKQKIIDDIKNHHQNPDNPLYKGIYHQCYTHAQYNAEYLQGIDGPNQQGYKYWNIDTTMGCRNRGINVFGWPVGQFNHTVTLVVPDSQYSDLGNSFIIDTWPYKNEPKIKDFDEWRKKYPYNPGDTVN